MYRLWILLSVGHSDFSHFPNWPSSTGCSYNHQGFQNSKWGGRWWWCWGKEARLGIASNFLFSWINFFDQVHFENKDACHHPKNSCSAMDVRPVPYCYIALTRAFKLVMAKEKCNENRNNAGSNRKELLRNIWTCSSPVLCTGVINTWYSSAAVLGWLWFCWFLLIILIISTEMFNVIHLTLWTWWDCEWKQQRQFEVLSVDVIPSQSWQ